MKIDNSTLRAMAQCTTQAVLRYGMGYTTPEEGAPLLAGSAVHAALDTYLTNGCDTRLALGMLAHEYQGWANEHVSPGDRLEYSNVRDVMVQWFADHTEDKLPWALKDGKFETGFTVEMDEEIEGLEFVGRLDGIVRSKTDGRWYVLEHKTTGMVSSFWTKQWQTASQVSGYIYAGAKIKGEPIVGAFINAIELGKLPSDPTRKCIKHKVTYAECRLSHAKSELIVTQRTPQQLASWKRDFVKLAKRFMLAKAKYGTIDAVLTAPQEGTFQNACTYCTFSQFCATGRPRHGIGSMLVLNPWEVIAVKGGDTNE